MCLSVCLSVRTAGGQQVGESEFAAGRLGRHDGEDMQQQAPCISMNEKKKQKKL
jgi:hypothetical protein